MDRRRLFSLAVGGVLGLSVMASVAADFDGPPTGYAVLCMLFATVCALVGGVLTASSVDTSHPVIAADPYEEDLQKKRCLEGESPAETTNVDLRSREKFA